MSIPCALSQASSSYVAVYRAPLSHMSVTIEPSAWSAHISQASRRAPKTLVPVDGPAEIPRRWFKKRIVATEAPSGTPSIRSTTLGTNDGSTRGRPMPSIRDAAHSTARPW